VARARNLKPALFKNEILGVADPMYTLIFQGLWLLADRAGRLEDRPLRIKGELFPYRDAVDVEGMLNWLVANEFIVRYTVAGRRFIQIKNFVKHQNPHKNEPESDLPSADSNVAPQENSEAKQINPVPVPIKSEVVPNSPVAHGLTPDSLSLDSLFIDSLDLTADGAVVPTCATSQSAPNAELAEKPKTAEKPKKTDWLAFLVGKGVDPAHARDWLTARGKKILSESAIQGVEREAVRAGISFAKAVEICAEKSWTGFNSAWDWVGKQPQQDYARRGDKYQPRQSNTDRRAEFAAGMSGKSTPPQGPQNDFIDVDAHVVA
jgi:hypothetical protein